METEENLKGPVLLSPLTPLERVNDRKLTDFVFWRGKKNSRVVSFWRNKKEKNGCRAFFVFVFGENFEESLRFTVYGECVGAHTQ